MLTGTITLWFGLRNFGFVEVRVPKTLGTQIDTYFLHRTNIRFMGLDEPKPGCIVQFEIGEVYPGKKFAMAADAKIFESKEQLAAFEAAEKAEPKAAL